MDMQTPADPTEPTIAGLSPILLACLLRQLLAALPAAATPGLAAENAEAARQLFFARQPRDPTEAAAAARAVTAHFAAMDLHNRAAQPGLSADTTRRLRASAMACSRAAAATDRVPRRAAPAEPKPPKPATPPRVLDDPTGILSVDPNDRFQPHDRFGQPIERWDTQRMTRAQVVAALAFPRDPAAEAAALADEARLIAEQQALEASGGATAQAAEKDQDADVGRSAQTTQITAH